MALYEQHFALLKEWNTKIALVSRKSIEFSFGNHYCDSIQISEFAHRYWKQGPVHDLGSGAGFPGVIFAIRYPSISVVLYERIQKKKSFLEIVQKELDLPNLSVEGELPIETHSGLFLARAVMPKPELFPFMAKRMRKGSILIVNSGGQSEPYCPTTSFHKKSEALYTLPLDCGTRRIEAYCST